MNLIDGDNLLEYHKGRIEYWKNFRKRYKNGSYSLNEACEIRIDTHQTIINMILTGSFAIKEETNRVNDIDELICIHNEKISHHRESGNVASEYFYRGYNAALRKERNQV